MKAISARATSGINIGSKMIASDNSGAKIVKIVSIKKGKVQPKKEEKKNFLNTFLMQ